MSDPFRRLQISWKAMRQLGAGQTLLYAWYRLNLASGRYSRQKFVENKVYALRPILSLPSRELVLETLGMAGKDRLVEEAEQIVQGRWHRFGDEYVPIEWSFPGKLAHWSEYERGKRSYPPASQAAPEASPDVKFLWEVGRFGWAYPLVRAYYTQQDERYAECFWTLAESFWGANPPGIGPHWTSAQEVALRLIALVFAGQVFSASEHSRPDRLARLAGEIAACAQRIPPTLAYARSQNNNHLLTEAAGLYTAALALPDHPAASRWRGSGWRWFHQGLRAQIDPDGAYIQQSANYQRLMLQVSLWTAAIASGQGDTFPRESLDRLAKATAWLAQILDPLTGRVPNLGPNDGAYILPFDTCSFEDYRPAVQAAGRAFLGENLFPPGPWDEQTAWLERAVQEIHAKSRPATKRKQADVTPHVLRCASTGSWAYLRAAHFLARPGHADQLHLDLWWQGINLAMDAGTYLYNGLPPWENALARTVCHNTVIVNGLDQMTRAGKFLWLDWAQAEVSGAEYGKDGSLCRLSAQHDGYRRLGLVHERTVACQEDGWLIEDRLLPLNDRLEPIHARLHWLLPDLPWQIEPDQPVRDIQIDLRTLRGDVQLVVLAQAENEEPKALQAGLIRAGKGLLGAGEECQTLGWCSPTYGVKQPALSFYIDISGRLPVGFQSRWYLPTIN